MAILNSAVLNDISSQIGVRPPYPNTDFSGKTVIVTGTNTGLGKEAVRHFVRLNAKKVIGVVRSIARGEAAKAEIEAETGRQGVVDLMECDLSSYASVKAFAANVATQDRVDAVVLNAGIATEKFEVFEDNESTITVNVVSTTLLILLLLPTLRSFAAKWDIVPVISVVGSGVHIYTKFSERKTANSLATLNNPETAVMTDRYAPPFRSSPFASAFHDVIELCTHAVTLSRNFSNSLPFERSRTRPPKKNPSLFSTRSILAFVIQT